MKRQLPIFALAFSLALGLVVSTAEAAPKYAGIVIDARTGKTLYESDADSLRYPASLTKMMTLYLVFEALESGRVRLDTKVPVSKNAAAEPPSKLGVRAGGSVTIEQGILALVTRSANDIATALGEYLGGSESRFAQMMTAKARSLGMSRTTYRNAHGLPNTAQMTTARDQAILGVALRQHFPQYYGYFSTRSFKFGKSVIGNHNRLLGNVRGVDGIKTGFTRAAGFNLVTSAQADGRTIVAVVMGGSSGARRDATMRELVAKYMPKASRSGRQSLLIARGSTSVMPADAMAVVTVDDMLPLNGPVPVARYEQAPVANAYAAPTESAAQSALAQVTATTSVAPAMATATSVPVPAPAPAYMPEQSSAIIAPQAQAPQQVASLSVPEGVDGTVTASTQQAAPVSGWIVQVGTSPDRDMAMELLRKAQDKGGKVLRSATPFTVAYDTGAAQVYRARFGGFDDQKSAVNACNSLKKKGIGCWAALQ
ncbi:SPOR domain-containing protein [Ciceribacter sp. L1K23]|uniref:SPOR domain-containing protein n=1 Tax=Ciceribacter sp. L1K23 TaxID=2820276 RepID=UPI001B835F37|nr:SPOR domain-containing protein [Ciceribacter sp. L1K23]MBR0555696.1 SPOR domain-containing protein [Ciceribacter sp. L1K23]